MTATPQTLTLAAWLLARLDEDEAVAREAVLQSFREWHAERWYDDTGERADVWGRTEYPVTMHGGLERTVATHIARHDPARVLAEVEAKRRIVEEHSATPGTQNSWSPTGTCSSCADYGTYWSGEYPVSWPCRTLRLLALPYAGHDQYREEWRP